MREIDAVFIRASREHAPTHDVSAARVAIFAGVFRVVKNVGRDIDVKGGIVFGGALPDAADFILLEVVEGGRVSVFVVGPAIPTCHAAAGVPFFALHDSSIEIKIQMFGGARSGIVSGRRADRD